MNGNCGADGAVLGSYTVAGPCIRSLMMRYVSAELAARSGLCVADPTWSARARSRARAPNTREVRKLADAMHASWVVRGTSRWRIAATRSASRSMWSIAILTKAPGAHASVWCGDRSNSPMNCRRRLPLPTSRTPPPRRLAFLCRTLARHRRLSLQADSRVRLPHSRTRPALRWSVRAVCNFSQRPIVHRNSAASICGSARW